MKHIVLFFFIFFLIQIIMSCASSQETVNYSYQKMDVKKQDAYTEVWNYRYSVADGPWEDINVYIRYDKLNYIINVDTDPGLVLANWRGPKENEYVYNTMKHPPTLNFASQTRAEQRSVNSLEEAVKAALSWFIEDNETR